MDCDYQRGGITGRFIEELIEQFRTTRIKGPTLYSKFLELYSGTTPTPDVNIRKTAEAGIDLIPADPRLSVVTVEKMPTTNDIRENTRSLWRHLSVLDTVLAPVRKNYDYILVDSHPDIDALIRTIIYACDFVCSPVKLDLQSTIGVASAIEAVNDVNDDVKLVENAICEELDYKCTQYAGTIATQAREWGAFSSRRREPSTDVFLARVPSSTRILRREMACDRRRVTVAPSSMSAARTPKSRRGNCGV